MEWGISESSCVDRGGGSKARHRRKPWSRAGPIRSIRKPGLVQGPGVRKRVEADERVEGEAKKSAHQPLGGGAPPISRACPRPMANHGRITARPQRACELTQQPAVVATGAQKPAGRQVKRGVLRTPQNMFLSLPCVASVGVLELRIRLLGLGENKRASQDPVPVTTA